MKLRDGDLELADELISTAADIALRHLQSGVIWRTKADGTRVTAADEEVEQALTELIRNRRPEDAILGEEFGAQGTSPRRWIIDPIDGTSNFTSDVPHWGSHVALESDGEIVLGIISRPLTSQSWWAVRGGGAFRNDWRLASTTAISVSSVAELSESRVAIWADSPSSLIEGLAGEVDLVDTDLNAIVDLAEGKIDAVIDPTGKPWDHAPAVLIVEEAGGRFSDHAGGQRIDIGEVRYSNGLIHEALVVLMDDSCLPRPISE